MDKLDFKEVQRFRTYWAWVGVIAANLLFTYAIVQQVLLGISFGPKPLPNLALFLLELVPLLLFIFLCSIRLRTSYDSTGIHYRYLPFQFRTTTIEWHELSDAYMRGYNSLLEYGGWGIRKGTASTGMAINTSASSNKGLQLRFPNGSSLLIGTRYPGEIEKIISRVMTEGRINRGV